MFFYGVFETLMIVIGRVSVFYDSIIIHFNFLLRHSDCALYTAGIKISFKPADSLFQVKTSLNYVIGSLLIQNVANIISLRQEPILHFVDHWKFSLQKC